MADNSGTRDTGVGFLTLLGLLFIGLKLGGVIDWSWWWVLAPLWVPLALVLTILGIVAAVMVFSAWRKGC